MEKNNNQVIDTFLIEHAKGINTILSIYFKKGPDRFIQKLKDNLKIELVSYLKSVKNTYSTKTDSLLLYFANDYCKKLALSIKKKYYCLGCRFSGRENILIEKNILHCEICKSLALTSKDSHEILLSKTFSSCQKRGISCPDCNRFIPNSQLKMCPYPDCIFVGELSSLKKINYPGEKDYNLFENESSEINMKILQEAIEVEKNNIPYNSSQFTIIHKNCCYQAFKNLLIEYPTQMTQYIIYKKRSGFQAKLFQEYTRLLELQLPFSCIKNDKLYRVTSLLDENLSIFDGISVFSNIVDVNGEIKNNTQEFYIGNRKSNISQPYFIGKLIDIKDEYQKSILSNMTSYSFTKIKTNLSYGTKVSVTHLRIAPHYQMGGMVYVNRAKENIRDKFFSDQAICKC